MKKNGFAGNDSYFAESSFYVMPDGGGGNAFRYDSFINSLTSAKMVAIKIIPTVDHEYYEFYNYATGTTLSWSKRLNLGPIWFSFPLKGAREAIAKLGKEGDEEIK
jgi:hypothetical protein